MLYKTIERVDQLMKAAAQGREFSTASTAELESQGLQRLPPEPLDQEQLLFRLQRLMEFSPDSSNPRFLNQLFGPRIDEAMGAEIFALAANTSMYTFKAAGMQILVEQEVLSALAAKAGLIGAEGSFTPGASLANLTAMVLARQHAFPQVREGGWSTPHPLVYTSVEGHYSVVKNAGILGLGRKSVRFVPVDPQGRMDPQALTAMVRSDMEQGLRPWMVNGTAGTTVRGAFDPLQEIGEVARDHGLWFHVDGALGASVLLSDRHRALMAGVEEADSLAWNAHKMMGLPLQTSILLCTHPGLLSAALDERADYLYQTADDRYNPGHRSIQCGRRNDALRLWAAWASLGDQGWEDRVNRQMANAQMAAEEIAQDPAFELLEQPPSVNVCFIARGIESEELCKRLDTSGSLKIGHGQVGSRRAIRLVCIDPTMDRQRVRWILAELKRHV